MKKTLPTITRFAPSPTGYLHVGHAYAARFAEKIAHDNGGTFLLRIEDIDQGRCRPEFERGIFDDLARIGLVWQLPVRRQSENMDDYQVALKALDALGLIYPCFCTRKDILAEINSSSSAPHLITNGPDGPLYLGRCRDLNAEQRAQKLQSGLPYALRLNMNKAIKLAGPLTWTDVQHGDIKATPEIFGDVVVARKDTPTSYHLAVTVDDHIQNVTIVTRGKDLFRATHIHRLLQALLKLNVPTYHHHELLLGFDGKRFAKRDQSQTIRALVATNHNKNEIGPL